MLDAGGSSGGAPACAELRADPDAFLSEVEAAQAREREEALQQSGIPPELARDIAMLPLADRALNVLRLCERVPIAPVAAARVYSRIGEGSGIHQVHRRLRRAEASGLWDRMVLVDLRFDLLDLQRQLTESVLATSPDDPLAAADAFLVRHETLIEQIRALEGQVAATDGPSALVVLTSRLRGGSASRPMNLAARFVARGRLRAGGIAAGYAARSPSSRMLPPRGLSVSATVPTAPAEFDRSRLTWVERGLRVFADVRPGEGRTALLMFANVFLILCAYYFIKPLREGWIAVSGVGGLSKLELRAYTAFGQSLLLIPIVAGYGRLVGRWPRAVLIERATLFCMANMLVFWALQPNFLVEQRALLGIAFYLWVGMFAVFVVAQFWAFAADLYDEERGNRLLPMIAIGATAGAAVGSLLLEQLVSSGAVPTHQVLVLALLPLAASIWLTRRADAAVGGAAKRAAPVVARVGSAIRRSPRRAAPGLRQSLPARDRPHHADHQLGEDQRREPALRGACRTRSRDRSTRRDSRATP